MALRQKRPGVSSGGSGGGGQKPLLNLLGALSAYDPELKVIPGQEFQGPLPDGSAMPSIQPELQIKKPNFWQRTVDPSALGNYNALRGNFELGNFQASQELANRLRAIEEMGQNQASLEDRRAKYDEEQEIRRDRHETTRQEAKIKADQTAAEAKIEAERATARQNLYLKNLENARKTELDMTAAEKAAALKDGIGDFNIWRQHSEPAAIGKFQLSNRSNQAILKMPDLAYDQAEQTRFLGDAQKQSVLNDNVRADTKKVPFMSFGKGGIINTDTGIATLHEDSNPEFGIKQDAYSTVPRDLTGFKKQPGGMDKIIKDSEAPFQGQGAGTSWGPPETPTQPQTTKPIFQPPQVENLPPLQGPAAPPVGEPYGLNPFNDPWMQQMGRDLIPSLLKFEDRLNPGIVNWLRSKGTLQ